MDTWAAKLAGLGSGLAGFVGTIREAGLCPEDLTVVGYAADAIKCLAKAAKEIPNTGGLLGELVGNNDMDTWAAKFADLGYGLTGFIATLKNAGLCPEDLTIVGYAADAITKLAGVAKEIPNAGGLLATLIGDNTMDDFGLQLPRLARGITGFVHELAVGGFTAKTASVIDEACAAIRLLAQLATDLDDNWWEKLWNTGNADAMANLATNLPSLGSAISGFAANAAALTEDQVAALRTAIDAVKLFLDLNNYSSNTGDASKLSLIAYNMKKFGEDMQKFSGYMTEDIITACGTADKVISSLSTMIAELGTIDLEPVNKFGQSFKDLGKSIGTDFVDNVASNEKINSAKSAGQTLINSVYTGLTTPSTDKKSISKIATEVVSNLKTHLTSNGNKEIAKGAGSTVVSSFAEAFEEEDRLTWGASMVVSNMAGLIKSTDNYDKMSAAGDYMVQGFAAGITANTFKAEAAATAMAMAAKTAAEEALGIKSPSRVFYAIGGFAGEGFINALADYIEIARNAGRNVAMAASGGLNDAIAKTSSSFSEMLPEPPTIRPIIDLTDVETGVSAISSMFGTDHVLGVTANVDSVGNMMTNRQNGATNADVVTAIDRLYKKLDGVGNTTYNVNGISYTGDADLDNAFQTIIQAARLERRS
jgi:hypothetical protein